MADHGENYERMTERDENDQIVEIGTLGVDCGHHCGVIPMGRTTHEAHCNGPECHDGNAPVLER